MEQWRKAEQEKLRAVIRPISGTVTGEKLTCTMEGAIDGHAMEAENRQRLECSGS
jgi:hypothetical protein